MLVEGVLEVKPLVAVRATKDMKGVMVAVKPQSGVEKAVAVMAETVACGTFMVIVISTSLKSELGGITERCGLWIGCRKPESGLRSS